MFKKDGTQDDTMETIIGPSVHVEGDFDAAGDVVIEGTVSGKLNTLKNLKVGTNARIFANVSAANAFVAGEIQGNLRIEGSLELSQSAKIFGDIKAKDLSIASGAVIHGKCQIGEGRKSQKVDKKSNSSASKTKSASTTTTETDKA